MNLQENNTCCNTTEDGNAVCNLPQNDESPGCACQSEANPKEKIGENVRSAGLFLVACLTSPCCTPLFVPLVLSIFTGTSLALWLNQNLFWVYGILTLISIASLVLALRKPAKPKAKQPNLISISSIQIGEKYHAESR